MVLGSKKRCFFSLCGIGAVLFLSSCVNREVSNETLLRALETFADRKNTDAGSKFDQLLVEVRALDKSFQRRLDAVNRQKTVIDSLATHWSNFETKQLPNLLEAARNLENYKDGFGLLCQALSNVGQFKELSESIEEFNHNTAQALGADAVGKLSDLAKALNGLDSSGLEDFKTSLKGFIEGVKALLNEDKGSGTVEDSVNRLNQSLTRLKNMSESFVKGAEEVNNAHDSLRCCINNIDEMLHSIQGEVDILSVETQQLKGLASLLAEIEFIIDTLRNGLNVNGNSGGAIKRR